MKSKLVSRNPIQRFKQGKSIIKAALGIKTSPSSTGTKIGDWERVSQGGKPLWFNRKQMKFLGNGEEVLVDGNYLKGDGSYTSKSLRTVKAVKQKDGSMLYKMADGTWRNEKGQRLVFASHQQTPIKEEVPADRKSITKPVDNYYLKGFERRQNEISKLGGVRAVQKMLGFTEGNGLDGKWGKNTEDAYIEYLQKKNAPELPSNDELVSYIQGQIKNPEIKFDTPNFGYRTNNTYDNQDFRNRLNSMGIKSNADLIDFGWRTSGENYDWKGDNWAKQFRGDINQALGGDWSDANIQKTFNTSGRWGNGFLGSGDISDFQRTLQTKAGAWNGLYDKNRANYESKNNWRSNLQNVLSLSYRKKGGTLSPRNPINRFKANFRLVAQ